MCHHCRIWQQGLRRRSGGDAGCGNWHGIPCGGCYCRHREHSICRMYGSGRPDAEDANELASFAADILRKIKGDGEYAPLSLPGNRPYKQGCKGPYPTANDNCTGCGTCASECPAGAISPDNLRGNDNGLCIGCMRCVAVCPVQARGIGDASTCLWRISNRSAVTERRMSCSHDGPPVIQYKGFERRKL
ncbi:4Fe-4S dicluster domain-containing protein [Prevotella sp. LMAG:51]|uniref:DUF362 domain-containing protein n=1 Tax=Prevotella sp. LMAG:51 TaxID=1969564 RepID=UPI00257B5B6C|nr:4Fe-4S dicluster domain-containing protein [Prevotella sp. LMAG:51]